MAFRDSVEEDITRTFLNFKEFAHEVWIEGRLCMIVMDDHELKTRQGGEELAIAESSSLFYIRTKELPKSLRPGMNLNINNREALVDDIKEDMGVSTVVLRENILT